MPREQENLLARFRRHVHMQALFEHGEHLLLAVSGGVDSRVLLDLLIRAREEWGLHLTMAHVQHQLRGEEAERDAEFAADLAQRAGLPFYCKRIVVQAFAQEKKISLETAARELRYKALAEICRDCHAAAIVTAHTQDDQVETILAHLLRGSGMRGLRGMRARSVIPLAQVEVKRPLLPFARREVLAYAQQQALRWREDQSNTDVRIYRNRVRHELLPRLRERFNPKINQSLLRLAQIAGANETYLEQSAAEALAASLLAEETDKIILDLQRFRNYFRAVQAYVIRAVMERLTAFAATLTFDETEQILSFLNPTHNQPLAFPRRRYLWRSEVEVYTEKSGVVFGKIHPTPQSRSLAIGQRCVLHDAGIAITITPAPPNMPWHERCDAKQQFVDAGVITGRLLVRFPRAGDRFMPLGMRNYKKLSDFFIDEKVPFARRPRVPLVECETGLVWVCGYRLDERFKVTPQTHNILQLKLESLSENIFEA